MNILDAILSAQNGAAVRQMASQVGLPADQTSAALSALVPTLAAGLQRNAQGSDGLDGLLAALASGGHARYVDNPAALAAPEAVADGNGILGHVLGSKEVSRQVASEAAAQTGIGVDVLKRMLPMAAALMMGTLARQSSTGGSLAAPDEAARRAGLTGLLAGMLDRNRDGSVLDDIAGMVGRTLPK